MINLDDMKWKEFDGGYRMPYDASVPLTRLEQATSSEEIDAIFAELWNELHHQGDVGLASYFSVPHILHHYQLFKNRRFWVRAGYRELKISYEI
jgi:hypothetical protein